MPTAELKGTRLSLDAQTIEGFKARIAEGRQKLRRTGDGMPPTRGLELSNAASDLVDGIVSDRGLLSVFVERGPDVLGCPLDEIMTRKVCTCSPGDSVGAIMSLMTERRIRHVPVVDQDGRLCGIVSIGDVVKHHVDEIQREAADLREYISGTV